MVCWQLLGMHCDSWPHACGVAPAGGLLLLKKS
jgi:hypothetical protein